MPGYFVRFSNISMDNLYHIIIVLNRFCVQKMPPFVVDWQRGADSFLSVRKRNVIHDFRNQPVIALFLVVNFFQVLGSVDFHFACQATDLFEINIAGNAEKNG